MPASLPALAVHVRRQILIATTQAGSGHPSSCLSAADLMVTLMFGGFFHFDTKNPDHPNNDRLIFSKGHAAPLLYELYAAAGAIPEKELLTLRQFGSRLEGHPTLRFPYTEAATGSLGQGLSIGVGMALNAKYLDKLPYRIFVLLGDSEMSEGSVWEAMALAAHYKLSNLVAIADINRLGQRGETMYGHDLATYEKKAQAFGWETITVDGHDFLDIKKAYEAASKNKNRPTLIIAKTIKGKGVATMENKNGWHGKVLSPEQLAQALAELGGDNEGKRKEKNTLRWEIAQPKDLKSKPLPPVKPMLELDSQADYQRTLSAREAYGHALVEMYPRFPNLVVLDAEVSNSSYAETFARKHPDRFFEMFIAEQNMVGVAVGLARRGKIPFVSTFAAFFTRAADQIRMAAYSRANIKFVGSHVGVSIGEDGVSQMGLEDLSLFRALSESTVLYPADHVAEEKLAIAAAEHAGLVYLRNTRMATAPIYKPETKFSIGGSHTLKKSRRDRVTLVAAGITLYEALKAYEILKKDGVPVRVIDLYSVKPPDISALTKAARETAAIITVEDHYPEGGLGEAVASTLAAEKTPVHILAVHQFPHSGRPEELLDYEGISAGAIVKCVKQILA